MSRQKRILIVRPDRIGDVVLSTPLPREIKKTFPDSFVAVLVRKYTQDIYVNNPNVDKILLIDDYDDGSLKSFFRKVREIRGYGFTHSLTLLPTERLNYLMFFSGILYRVGVSHKFYQFITFTHYVSRRKYIPLKHEADYCMDLARKIGVNTTSLNTEIFLTEEEKKKVLQTRNQLLGGKKYLIGVHASSGNSAPNWEADEYKKLIQELSAAVDFSVVVTDNKIPSELEGIPSVSYPNIGKSLRDSIINFAALDLLISSSTGPMHIAAALKVKTLSMFCPLTACSPKLWGPLGNESKIVLPSENYCQTVCPGDPKKCSFAGEGGIDSNRILEELKLFLYLHPPTGR
ncbi:MAG: glycosyltransferase family 9 protein [Bacteroidetes bacterium]|nr:glycosyltransferase family 9 protein [Bacteroidota bacterium]